LNDEGTAPALRGMLAAGSGAIAFPDEVRVRVAQRIALATATSVAVASVAQLTQAATGTGAASTAAATLGVKLTGALMSVALGAALTTTAVVQREQERVLNVAAPVAQRVHARATLAGRMSAAPAETLELRPIGELPFTVDGLPLLAPSVEIERDASGAARPSTRDATFERELHEVRELRQLLHERPEEALARLRTQERELARSQFAAERQLLELQALLALGRRSEASALGERMLANDSAAWYHERIRALLATSSGASKARQGERHSPMGTMPMEGER
jgi:hypothetical protein